MVRVYTDGACQGNPGPGAWAFIVFSTPQYTGSGYEEHTTNNRMELMAVIQALEQLSSDTIEIVTDSQYVQKGITTWIHAWEQRGWRNAQNQAVKNQDLWQRLRQAEKKHPHVSYHWVKGHAQEPGNEAADALARATLEAKQA